MEYLQQEAVFPHQTAIASGSDVMSVPDQFMFRTGANLSTHHFLFSAGMRIEGVPAEDLIGAVMVLEDRDM